ncbi:hypothetical protein SO802_020081 [Lithocarpus litseifolius]|uniref:Uncharacterized protein n=1 Tax=Lithocarpus litseifolius TaxID=425828 RepID=A0AAW2CEF7_9ROSI
MPFQEASSHCLCPPHGPFSSPQVLTKHYSVSPHILGLVTSSGQIPFYGWDCMRSLSRRFLNPDSSFVYTFKTATTHSFLSLNAPNTPISLSNCIAHEMIALSRRLSLQPQVCVNTYRCATV